MDLNTDLCRFTYSPPQLGCKIGPPPQPLATRDLFSILLLLSFPGCPVINKRSHTYADFESGFFYRP